MVDLRWYETWWTHTVYSQWGLHAGPMSPPDTASSHTLPPRKCPPGSAHLCRGGMAAYQVSGPKKTHIQLWLFKLVKTIKKGKGNSWWPPIWLYGSRWLACSHVYLIEWKWEDIRRHIFLPVYVINLLDPVVIHADDAQVKFLDAQYVSQHINVPAQPGAAERHHLLEVPQYYSHCKIRRKKRKRLLKKSWDIGESLS